MKGFKATDQNGRCRDMTFEVGKIYTVDGPLKICANGFHFCKNLLDVYNYYEKSENTRLFEVEALSEVETEGDKSVTLSLKIVRELSDKEILKAWINRTNSGNRNSGDWNSGYGNSGNRNSGDWNSGNWNSGNRNSGYGNSGDWNSGYGNSGNRNSGDWNSGYGNSGYFNTSVPVYFFNRPSEIKWTQKLQDDIRSINVKPILTYVNSSSMSEEEKVANPSHVVTGGFLRKTKRMDWSQLTDSDKKLILSLPNYDDEVFKVISGGISLLKPKTIKVTYEGQEFELDLEKAKELGIIK